MLCLGLRYVGKILFIRVWLAASGGPDVLKALRHLIFTIANQTAITGKACLCAEQREVDRWTSKMTKKTKTWKSRD